MGLPAETDFHAVRRSFEAMRATTLALRDRAGVLGRDLREAHAALVGVVDVSRRTLSTIRAARAGQTNTSAFQRETSSQDALSQNDLPHILAAAGLDMEDDLNDLTTGLIAAYRDASAQDDDELTALLGGALREIGRYIATRVGPRAAGLRLT